jgi:hypothetical protein
MKKAALTLAIATLGLSAVTVPSAYANGTGYRYYDAPAYYGGYAPAHYGRGYTKTFYGYVPGQTTTFSNGYVPGYGYTHGNTTVCYNGYAPYPYGGWWERPGPSAPTSIW